MKTHFQKMLVGASLLSGLSSAALAGQREFQELCEKRKEQTAIARATDVIVRELTGPFGVDKVDCAEAAAKAMTVEELNLPGSTFHYYRVSDLTPFVHLQKLKTLSLESQKIQDLTPLLQTKVKSLDLLRAEVDLSPLEQMPLETLAVTVNAEYPLKHLPQTLRNLRISIESSGAPRFFVGDLNGRTFYSLAIEAFGFTDSNGNRGKLEIEGLDRVGRAHLQLEGVKVGAEDIGISFTRSLVLKNVEIMNVELLKLNLDTYSVVIQNSGLKNVDFLKTIPGSMYLMHLDLSGNDFSAQEALIGLKEVPRLESLILRESKVTYMREISNLFRLKRLEITKARSLSFLLIEDLRHLEKLIVEESGLSHFDSKEGTFPKLKELSLRRNLFSTARFINSHTMPNLVKLDIS
ncbi:MAG: hypothetical protein AB7O96_13005, partial [Pseudobdellovibrionaceae bacterium]